MKSLIPAHGSADVVPAPGISDPEKQVILRELESILASPFFRTSNRSKQFLSFVVHFTLEGNHEPLKERTIGAKLFERPVGYATGDDPVVRVQAGEVRRRLEQYQHAAPANPTVRIELPVGSYTPAFVWEPAEAVKTEQQVHPVEEPPAQETISPVAEPSKDTASASKKRLPLWVVMASLGLVLLLSVSAIYRFGGMQSTQRRFWAPVFATSQPVLICLAKPRVYRPAPEIYQRFARSPGDFSTEWERLTQSPPLDPATRLTWGDMKEYTDFGVAAGDVYAALRMTAALTGMGKPSQVRIGSTYSFEDLRSSPAIVVGAFNNRWTMQMTSNLHFVFAEENGRQMIREQGPKGRTWSAKISPAGEVLEDYGIVSRLLYSKTGNFVVATAGLMSNGTQAAAEFVSSPEYLEEALRNAPSDWPKKNLQFVIHTTVTDTIPGPPQIVASYSW
jgi:hypothetical protein